MKQNPNYEKIQATLTMPEDIRVYTAFEKARKYYPQSVKNALIRAMSLYIEEVERLNQGWRTTHVVTTEDLKEGEGNED